MSAADDADWIRVAARDALGSNGMLAIEIGGRSVALYDVDGEVYATDNECTHAMAWLTDGWLEEGVVECPLHGGRFCVKTGAGLGPPIPCDVRTHAVRVADGAIHLRFPTPAIDAKRAA